MGGIFAAVSRTGGNAFPPVIRGLARLRHRGYDSAGFAALRGGFLEVYKDVGSLEEVAEKFNLESITSPVVLGHTRYATHGRPTRENAHPHLDCRSSVAVVGDGSIGGYEKLKDSLLMRGHRLVSRCDFELPAHLLEEELEKGVAAAEALSRVAEQLEGFYAVAALFRDEGCIAATSTHTPLYLGLSRDYYLLSSTEAALLDLAEEVVEVLPGEVVRVAAEGFSIYTRQRSPVNREARTLSVDPRLADREGFPHHMLREIYEVPYALLRTLYTIQAKYLQLSSRLITGADRIYIIANGTSLHAGLVAGYYLSELAGISPVVVSAAEFPLYYVENVGPGSLVIAISQSGETGDVLSSLYEAKLRGATILGVTNYVGSRLARLSNVYLPIGAGPEIAVPATKTFTSTLLLLYLSSLQAGRDLGKVSQDEHSRAVAAVKTLAQSLAAELPQLDRQATRAAAQVAACRGGYVVSRGITYPLALEGALKLKEAAYFHAEGVEAGEFKHGPFVLIEKGFFAGFIVPVEKVAAEATYPLITAAAESGATVVAAGFEGDEKLARAGEAGAAVLTTVRTERHLAPISLAVPLQLFAYRLGEKLGRPIDAPRYLTKAVLR
ncbi:MAG: glutamine--fructose-6-phosphate transaminase (isomerizing) [Thermofilum sp.]